MSVIEEVNDRERAAEKQDCAMEIGRLGIQIGLLESEARKNPVIKAELDDLIAARQAAENRMHEMIGQEREERLSAEAAAVEAEERRQEHLARAREIGAARVSAARAVDSALRKFACALAAYEEHSQAQANELIWAGERQAADIARPRAYRVNGALRLALSEAKVPGRSIELPATAPSTLKPLSEADPQAIVPAEAA